MPANTIFQKIFYPRSVALIGISSRQNWTFLRAFFFGNFNGRLYPINPKVDHYLGLKFYPSVRDVPDEIDYAVILTPANSVPGVIEECIDKKISAVHIFSSGFSEHSPEGKKLEEELVRIAKGKIRIIGPNCMGVYCPESGLTYRSSFSPESGKLAFISQSGGFSIAFVLWAQERGIRFSKVVSYGNACDLNETDLIEYLGNDEKTGIIAAYIEGIKGGRRFLDVCRKVSMKKPLIIWKSGKTEDGARAIASHTGALTGSAEAWDAAMKQCGAICTDSFEDTAYTSLAFYFLPYPRGRRVGCIEMSGGASVVASDACSRAGLSMPPPSEGTAEKLRGIVAPVGTSVRNPIDLAASYLHPGVADRAIELLGRDKNMDSLIVEIPLRVIADVFFWQEEEAGTIFDAVVASCKKIKETKPTPIVIHPITSKTREAMYDDLVRHKFPVFPDEEVAVKALARMLRYKEWLKPNSKPQKKRSKN